MKILLSQFHFPRKIYMDICGRKLHEQLKIDEILMRTELTLSARLSVLKETQIHK